MTGCEYKNSQMMFQRIREDHPDVMGNIGQYKFPGKGQRSTYVATALGLLTVFSHLPKKYSAKYNDECNKLMVRYLGGDTSIGKETEVFREVQERLPESNPMRQCGADVEAGVAGNLASDKMQQAAIAWHDKREKSATVRECLPNAGQGVYKKLNAGISYSVTGEYPNKYKASRGVKRGSARDIMTEEQLSMAHALERAIERAFKKHKDDPAAREQEVKRLEDNFYNAASPFHHESIQAVPPRPAIESPVSNNAYNTSCTVTIYQGR